MGCGDTINLAGTETREERKCARCGAQSWLAHVLLDSRKGVAVHVFECRCSERIWEEQPCGKVSI